MSASRLLISQERRKTGHSCTSHSGQKATYASQQNAARPNLLFDHLVGGHLNDHGHVETKRLRDLEVERKLEFGGLHPRQVWRVLTLENSSGIDARLVIGIALAGRVAHQTTGHDCLAQGVYRRNCIASG